MSDNIAPSSQLDVPDFMDWVDWVAFYLADPGLDAVYSR